MKIPHALSPLALLAMLSACSVSPPAERTAIPPSTGAVETQPAERPLETPAPVATPAPPPAPQPPQSRYRPGIGTVESASVVSLPSSQSAAGGASGPTMGYWLRMDDGARQSVVQTGERFEVGDRVEISPDGRLTRR